MGATREQPPQPELTGLSRALGPEAPCSGLAAPTERSPQMRKALPGVWPDPREEPGGCVRRRGTGVNQPPLQAAV